MRPLGSSLLGLLVLIATAIPAWAEPAYPSRPVRLVVPFVAGGTTDVVARKLAALLTPELGQPVVVENRGGASGVTGTEAVARAPADGYTLLLGHNAPLSIVPNTRALPYDPERAFAPISLITVMPQLLVVNAQAYPSLAALLAAARARPGALNFASGGIFTAPHLAGEMLRQAAGISIVHVPFNGSVPSVTSVVAGQVEMAFDNIGTLTPHIRGGRLRPLALAAEARSVDLPDVPTFGELGLPDVRAETWFGLLTTHGTPEAVLTLLSEKVRQALTAQEFADYLRAQAATASPTSPAEFAAFIHADLEKWRQLIRSAQLAAAQ